jgi:ubiquinol-cytochrome c reductase cytochrome c subunit
MVSRGARAAARRVTKRVASALVAAPFIAAGVATLFAVPTARADLRPPAQAASRRPVEQIYLADCATCHGGDARGTDRGPSLVGVGRAAVDYYLTTGRMPISDPAMFLGNPAEEPKRRKPFYSPATITALEDYIESLTGPEGPPIPELAPNPDRAVGGELFRLQCAACHAWAGDGGALLHREAPELHHATPTQIAEAVRVGPGNMPAFGIAAVDDQQLSDLASYVRYLAHPEDRGGQPLWHLGPFAEGFVAWAIGMVALIFAIRWIGERK